jgi:membrane protein YqaA with SNARE-associated domain
MKNKEPKKILQSILCILFVVVVIVCAFAFKEKIEKYAATGYLGVLLACFASTATILLPAPGIIVVIQYSKFLNPLLVILLGSLGTASGELLGYLLGRNGNELAQINTNKKTFSWLRQKPIFAVFLFSLIPFPIFDIVGVCAGIIKVNPLKFIVACFLGKFLKMTGCVALVSYAQEIISVL